MTGVIEHSWACIFCDEAATGYLSAYESDYDLEIHVLLAHGLSLKTES